MLFYALWQVEKGTDPDKACIIIYTENAGFSNRQKEFKRQIHQKPLQTFHLHTS